MKTDIYLSIRLFLAFVVGEMLAVVGADSQTGYSNNDYYNNPHYGDSNYGDTYDTGDQGIPPPEVENRYPTSIACFTCTLVQKHGVNQGMEHCQDPFNRMDIPSVDCKGPCAKMFHQHGEDDTMITRSCLPNCKEHRDDRSYTQCCSEPYCNTASRSTTPASLALSVSLVLSTLWILRR